MSRLQGRVPKVPPAWRRLARAHAAPGEGPSASGTSTSARHTESTHRTPPGPPSGRTTGLSRRVLAAALTMVAAAALAVGAAFGVVALLEATPDQPNNPLITYENAGQER